ncbi:trypsin-1 [Folsomia candida]|uniref:Chymotrypsin-1 n=1 Tax=Folsomia candida TaxID=158441 RepID=A0A226F2U9_FOLCA|nr:trypsin-1 [Folsomia candida]OXA64125.1 Chymotrypsin-1 [Folsomia candida]
MCLKNLPSLLCALTLFTICHSFKVDRAAGPGTLIVGGSPAARGEFPWLVSIQLKDFGHICGGTILNSEWILTAAHCMFEEYQSEYQIVAGDHLQNQTDPSEQIVDAEDFFVHGNYDDDYLKNDIGLIRLKSPIKFDDVVKAAKIGDNTTSAENQLITAGWGDTEYGTPSSSIQLLKVTVPLRPNADCDLAYGEFGYTGVRQICAGIGGKDSCSGDSGGGLINAGDKTVVGIVSYGIECGLQAFPGVYTRISYYHDWIMTTISKAESTTTTRRVDSTTTTTSPTDSTKTTTTTSRVESTTTGPPDNKGSTIALHTKFAVFLASIFQML